MSEPADRPPGRRPPGEPPPFGLFVFWGRETVKDAILLLLAIPPLVGLVYVVAAIGNPRWWAAPVIVVVGGLVWWVARHLLRAWVARGETETPDPPSQGARTKG